MGQNDIRRNRCQQPPYHQRHQQEVVTESDRSDEAFRHQIQRQHHICKDSSGLGSQLHWNPAVECQPNDEVDEVRQQEEMVGEPVGSTFPRLQPLVKPRAEPPIIISRPFLFDHFTGGHAYHLRSGPHYLSICIRSIVRRMATEPPSPPLSPLFQLRIKMWVPSPSTLQPSLRSYRLSRQHQKAEHDEEHSLEDRQKQPDHAKGDQRPADHQHDDSFDLPFHQCR